MVGSTLGHYEIIEPLGAGGMGEVFRAHDTILNRDVAIKLLPQDFAEDADRLARFERMLRFLSLCVAEGLGLSRAFRPGGMRTLTACPAPFI